jgi:hypothetical protein
MLENLIHLGDLHEKQDKYEADTMYKRVVKGFKSELGFNHELTLGFWGFW